MSDLTLILDADDTLWENNIYYEEVRQAFADRMAEEGFDRAAALDALDTTEHERVPQVGYAPCEFVRSVVIAYRRLCASRGEAPDEDVAKEVRSIAHHVIDHPIILLDGVAETLQRLDGRHRLILLTKGDLYVQQDKVDRSGLGAHFEAVHVVPEKGAHVLRDLLTRHDLDPRRTWMVGNSPRSDINPALEAGIGAVYIPHPVPWDFEDVSLVDPERVVTLERFGDLPEFLDTLGGER
jgi:putative hydrolase of the HAD superfamily